MSHSTTKQTNWPVLTAKTQISLGIHPVWSEFWLWTVLVAKDPRCLPADREDCSDRAYAQVDPSYRLAQRLFCWFCCAVTLITLIHIEVKHLHYQSTVVLALINYMNYMSNVMRKLFYATCEQQRPDQSRYPRSLISAFVVHCLDSKITLFAIAENSRPKLVSEADLTGLSLIRSQTPKTSFLVARLISSHKIMCSPCITFVKNF